MWCRRSAVVGPFYFSGEGWTPYVTGARIELDYDPAQIEAHSVAIEVLTPDGQKVETAFRPREIALGIR
jgi:hypothetical protein